MPVPLVVVGEIVVVVVVVVGAVVVGVVVVGAVTEKPGVDTVEVRPPVLL